MTVPAAAAAAAGNDGSLKEAHSHPHPLPPPPAATPATTTTSTHATWMNEAEWSRLFKHIRPTPMTLLEFKRTTLEGQLVHHTKALQLSKIMRELRNILMEHGWLREAEVFPKATIRKQDMNDVIVCATRLAAPPSSAAPVLNASPPPPPPPLPTRTLRVPVGEYITSEAAHTPHRTPGEGEPHVASVGLLITSPAEVREGGSGGGSSKGVPADLLPTTTVPCRGSPQGASSTVQSATALQRSVEAAFVTAAAAAAAKPVSVLGSTTRTPQPLPSSSVRCPSQLSSTLGPLPTSSSAASSSLSPALAMSNPTDTYSSPLGRIVVILKRFQLRMGSFTIRYEIPQQHINDIANRRLRVQVIPMTGTAPAVWPKVKELFVFVNERTVQAAWKRAWPLKKWDIAKAYLPLDVTQFLSSPIQSSQRIQLDCFNQEYCGSFTIALVSPKTEQDILQEWTPKASRSLRDLQPFYVSMLRPSAEEREDDDVVYEAPTVTLKCPISQMRIVTPVRGKHCRHLQVVDFAAFVRYCHISCYWNCPLCDASMRIGDVLVDQPLWETLQRPESKGWSHVQLSQRDIGNASASPYVWSISEKHRHLCEDVDDDDEDDAYDEHSRIRRPPAAKRPRDSDTVHKEGFDGDAGTVNQGETLIDRPAWAALGTADEPIIL